MLRVHTARSIVPENLCGSFTRALEQHSIIELAFGRAYLLLPSLRPILKPFLSTLSAMTPMSSRLGCRQNPN